MTTNLQRKSWPQPTFRVVVLYDQSESGAKAKALLGRVLHNASWEGKVDSFFWRFDVVSRVVAGREALSRATDADMILLAGEEMAIPLDSLIEWLECWANHRRVRDALVAAWCHRCGQDGLSRGMTSVRDLARRHGLQWLCAGEPERYPAESVSDTPHPAQATLQIAPRS